MAGLDAPLDLRAAYKNGTRSFLNAWYSINLAEPPKSTDEIPFALAQWRHWQRTAGTSLTEQNYFPEKLVHDENYVVFYVENQSVVSWGYPAESTEGDPAVFERVNDGQSAWRNLELPISSFIQQVALFEAAFRSGQFRMTPEAPEDAISKFAKGFDRYELAIFEGMEAFIGHDDVLVVAGPDHCYHAPRFGYPEGRTS